MSITTLTTDFGLRDYYLAALKGSLITANPVERLIDVTHEIGSHDIVKAAFVIKNIKHTFPKETIHLIYVKNHESKQQLIIFKKDDQYFIGPNNGLFSLVFETIPEPKYSIERASDDIPPFRLIAECIQALRSGKTLDEIGQPIENFMERLNILPIVQQNQIRASVIHIDTYGNVIVNVQKELFERVRQNRPFKIFFKRTDPITKISDHYSDGKIGEAICVFNMSNYMVIATMMGRAHHDLGLNKEETIQIMFG